MKAVVGVSARRANPFINDRVAVNNSAYYAPGPNGSLLSGRTGYPAHDGPADHVHRNFRAFAGSNPKFPCFIGRGAINQDRYRFGRYRALGDRDSTLGLCHDLHEFVQDQPTINAKYTHKYSFSSFLAFFQGPPIYTEHDFETLLWAHLQHLHDYDAAAWDATTRSDPADAMFSFSFAGQSFFVIGMHGSASRKSRRFDTSTLVFNAHHQFETMKTAGTFDPAQQKIRQDDAAFDGGINPNLADYGQDSEAKQYSGRHVQPGWICPFKPRP